MPAPLIQQEPQHEREDLAVPLLYTASPLLLVSAALAQQGRQAFSATVHFDKPGVLEVGARRHGIQVRLENCLPAAECRVWPPADWLQSNSNDKIVRVVKTRMEPTSKMASGVNIATMPSGPNTKARPARKTRTTRGSFLCALRGLRS
jgi:hypothetical protein